jgi:hypothetical protein
MAATASNQPSDLEATGTRLALGAMAAINQVLLKSESAAVSEQMVAANRIQVLLENVIKASYVLVESVKNACSVSSQQQLHHLPMAASFYEAQFCW